MCWPSARRSPTPPAGSRRPKRYWAVVGNGPNRVAAEEVRIKLSELCYKSIAADATEDKKHIDLSSEPLILVCAAGLRGSTADDVAKETAIFRAHKATPIVIADEGEQRYSAAATITVPPVDPALGFVLSAMVGHLFGYEAALAIDGSARPLREAREAIERAVAGSSDGDAVLAVAAHAVAAVRPPLPRRLARSPLRRPSRGIDRGAAGRPAARPRCRPSPSSSTPPRRAGSATPGALVDELVSALTRAIEELTRPIDAIKHQAKTVTVGISRSDEGVVDRALVQATLRAGAGRDVLSYHTLKVLADLDPAVAEVTGFTRYRVDDNTISIVDRDGISRDLPSRVDSDSRLVGTKHRVAESREVLVARGRRDQRTVIFVPEVKAGTCTGITLLHVRFHDRLDAAVMRGVLQGYDNRYSRLVDWVSETEGEFDESKLAELPVADALIAPISDTADRWRSDVDRPRSERDDRHRGRRRRDRTLPPIAGTHAVDARALVHRCRARVRGAQVRSGAVARGPVRRPRSSDEVARPRARRVRVPRGVGRARRVGRAVARVRRQGARVGAQTPACSAGT